MKVLYFSRAYTPHDHRFLEGLSRSEYEVVFLQLEQEDGSETRPLPAGVRRIPNPWRRKGRNWLRTVGMVKDIKRLIHDEALDLIHAGPIQGSAFLTALAGFHPLVSMSWGSDLLVGARQGFGRLAARHTLSRSDVFVCDCQTVRRKAMELGMSPDRIAVFPWGVDLDHFSPGREDGLRALLGWQDAFTLLSTRAWETLTGIDVLVDGFIRAATVDPSLRLLLLGTGSLQPDVYARLQHHGMLDWVYMPGQVGFADLPTYYRSADLYLSASTSDGSSVSLMEALACGCPALVSDIPGNREWVEPDEHGWWFEVGNVDDLAQAILRARDGRHRLQEMGTAGRELAERRADWNRNFQKLLSAYELAVSLTSRHTEGVDA